MIHFIIFVINLFQNILYDFSYLQFFPGEEYVIVFPQNTETKMRQLCMRSAVTNLEHIVWKYSQWNVTLWELFFYESILRVFTYLLTCFSFIADYLLSNNHVNSIIVHKFDFSDEEVMAYYISFLKTLSLKLNCHTVHFFYNEVRIISAPLAFLMTILIINFFINLLDHSSFYPAYEWFPFIHGSYKILQSFRIYGENRREDADAECLQSRG